MTNDNLTLLETEQGHDIFFRNSDRRFVVRYSTDAELDADKTENNERVVSVECGAKVRERDYDTFDAARAMVWTRIDTREKVAKTPLALKVTSENRPLATIKGIHQGNGRLLFVEKGADKTIDTNTYGDDPDKAYILHDVTRQGIEDIKRRRALIAAEKEAIFNIQKALAPFSVLYNPRKDGENALTESYEKARAATEDAASREAVGAAIWHGRPAPESVN